MKSLFSLTFIAALFFSSTVFAQAPKDGAILKLKETEVELAPGKSVSTHIEVIRSKRFQKAKIQSPQLGSSIKGLEASFEPTETADLYLLTLTATKDLKLGTNTIIVKGDPKWGRKIRSTMLVVNVKSAETLISDMP